MGLANGVHHLAVCTRDIKAQIEFFTDVLGTELVALYWMHGVEGAWHGFLRLADSSYLAFVQTDAIKQIPRTLGVTHAGSGGGAAAGGAMQHVAFNVPTLEGLLALRDRIRSRGVNVFGPLDHGLCHSIYFAGPEDLTLEIATSAEAIDARAWIDPEVVELAGISAAELARFRAPAAFRSRGGAVPQPPIDPTKPHQRGFPERAYRTLMEMPDAELTKRLSESTPPVAVERAQRGK
jgi:catechol 2,3-dioxygenase-like lactoylglutathione lyase family enzyme